LHDDNNELANTLLALNIAVVGGTKKLYEAKKEKNLFFLIDLKTATMKKKNQS